MFIPFLSILVVPQPIYMNMSELAVLAAQRAQMQQHQGMQTLVEEDSPDLKTPTAEGLNMVPGEEEKVRVKFLAFCPEDLHCHVHVLDSSSSGPNLCHKRRRQQQHQRELSGLLQRLREPEHSQARERRQRRRRRGRGKEPVRR